MTEQPFNTAFIHKLPKEQRIDVVVTVREVFYRAIGARPLSRSNRLMLLFPVSIASGKIILIQACSKSFDQ